MKKFDVLVIGGGTGNNVATATAESGFNSALIEKDKLGGTCLNRGCNPSKILIEHANKIEDIKNSKKFHINSNLDSIEYKKIIEEMDSVLSGISEDM